MQHNSPSVLIRGTSDEVSTCIEESRGAPREMSSNASVSSVSNDVGEGSGVQFKLSSKQRLNTCATILSSGEKSREMISALSASLKEWLRRLKKLRSASCQMCKSIRLESTLAEWPSVARCRVEVKDSGVPGKVVPPVKFVSTFKAINPV